MKIIAPSTLSGIQFSGNRFRDNGSIGPDLTSGGFTRSDIFDNRITNNAGIGVRVLGIQSKVRIKNNRCGDTCASGRTQTHDTEFSAASVCGDTCASGRAQTHVIEFSAASTLTQFGDTGNDVTGNLLLVLSVAGTLASCKFRDNTAMARMLWTP